MKQYKTKRILITCFLTLVLAFGGLFAMVGCRSSEAQRDLDWEEVNIWYMLGQSSKDLRKHISIEKRLDENGDHYLVGVLDDELDGALEDLVKTYNADPSTEKKVTLEEVRFVLTDGLAEYCLSKSTYSPTEDFLDWCGVPADLVYKKNYRDDDGHLEYTEGAPANEDGDISNFEFGKKSKEAKEKSLYRYAWQ